MTDEKKPFHNPFAALRDKLGDLPEGPAPRPAPPPKGPAKAVVRMERKGRSGKEVTVVEQLELPPRELEAWLKDLKGALGCGGAIEGSTLVLQGDQRKRLPALLSARGARKVVVG
ncbi:MAG TPA: translation initiation factor [Myxococcales bacterium]|nr:translation initiation factor [Myxococcales bacterium]